MVCGFTLNVLLEKDGLSCFIYLVLLYFDACSSQGDIVNYSFTVCTLFNHGRNR